WNTGFRALANDFVFRPLLRPMGAVGAAAATFLASGLVHDLVISVPARGGFGRPTLYFLIQFAGVLLERTRLARRLGFGRGLPGRVYMLVVTIAPMPLLFHPPFVQRVMVPLLRAIGAI